jgi:predicted nucleic acid-binding protein
MSAIVVADAGPLHYLILIDCAELLPKLFDHVLVPLAVQDELLHQRAPQKVKDWLRPPRPWLEIAPVKQALQVRGLDKGETEALQLALERRADAVLMDDMDGRAAARQLGIQTIYTIAILELAAEKHLVDLPTAIGDFFLCIAGDPQRCFGPRQETAGKPKVRRRSRSGRL